MKCKYTKNIYLRQETTFASANVIAQCASVVSPSVWTEHVGAGHVGAGSEPPRTECDRVEPARTECDRVEPARTRCGGVEPAHTECDCVEPACIPTDMQRKNLQRVYAKRQF